MANKAYRSRSGTAGSPSPWSNTGGATWDVYSTTATGGVFPAGTWSQAAIGDYPGNDDYVWLQSTYIVSYDAPAIAANNSSTFIQISARTDASGALIAQPTGAGGIGASNLTTGYLVFTTASTTVISADYFAPYTNTSANGMFYINVFNPSPNYFEFNGSLIQSNNGRFIVVASSLSSGNWIKYLGTLISGGSANSQAILVNSASKIDVTGDVTSGNEYCIELGLTTGSIVNVTGNVNGSNVNPARPAIVSANTTGTNIVNVAGDIQSGTLSPAINLGLSATPAANNVVNITSLNTYIKNYGLSGVTPTGTASAIVAANVNVLETTTISYNFSTVAKNFSATTAVYPSAQYVLSGSGLYGPGGTGYTPTLTLPSDSNVLTTQGVYGVGGTGSNGTYVPVVVSNVRKNINYGAASALQGTCYVPAQGVVLTGNLVDTADTGQLTLPSAATVFSGVTYGSYSSIQGTLDIWSQSVTPYTDPTKFGGLINQLNTNLTSAQSVLTTTNSNVISAQTVLTDVNTNVNSVQQVTGNIQQVTLSTQAVVDSIQAVTGTPQDIANQVWSDFDTNPNNSPYIQRVHNVSTVDTTGQQISTI
jgi:hypothetical protein